MSSADRAVRIRHKVERAKKHIADLDLTIARFFDSRPYKIATKRNAETRRPIHYLESVKDVPIDVALITGDVIHNLRAALDHLAYALVLANRKIPGRQTYFPIAKDLQTYTTEVKRKVKGMSKAATDMIDSTKPYQGGNDNFWILNELNNVDKHHLILTVGSACASVDFGGHISRRVIREVGEQRAGPVVSAFFGTTPMMPAKAGEELFIGLPDEEPDNDLQFRFVISLGEPEIVRGKALVETVQKLFHLVDGTVSQFEPLL